MNEAENRFRVALPLSACDSLNGSAMGYKNFL